MGIIIKKKKEKKKQNVITDKIKTGGNKITLRKSKTDSKITDSNKT